MLESKQRKQKKVFLSYGAKDVLDPEGVIQKQLSNFIQLIESDDHIDYKFNIYQEEGHVPYQSLYHGLKFIYE
jgi:hypothetical protein